MATADEAMKVHLGQNVRKQVGDLIRPEPVEQPGVLTVIGLIEVIPLAEAEYERRRTEHLAARPFEARLYGWILRNPQSLPEIIPIPGRMRLFNVELSLEQMGVAKADGKQSLPDHKVKETTVSTYLAKREPAKCTGLCRF